MNTYRTEEKPTSLGTYSISVSALYIVATTNRSTKLKLSTKHLYRWTREGLAGGYLAGIRDHRLFINFRDLISLRAIAIMRASGMKHHDIQIAERVLATRYNCIHPFASLKFWTMPPRDIFVKEDNTLLSASRHMQAAMDIFGEYLQPMHDLVFDMFGLSAMWRPHENVLFDPQIQYGEPCIEGTRVPTQVVWSFHTAGDSIDNLSLFYGIQRKRIEDAIAWENQLQTVANIRNQ